MKDSKGHGSNGRGVSAVQARNDRMFAMFERAPGLKAKAAADQAKRNAFTEKYGNTGGSMASRDAAAAKELSQGAPPSKAGPAPVHGGMTSADRAAAAGPINYHGSGTGPGGIGERKLTSRKVRG